MPFFANEETRTNGKPKSWFVLCRIKLFALSFNAYDRITLATKNLYYPTLEVINTSLRKELPADRKVKNSNAVRAAGEYAAGNMC